MFIGSGRGSRRLAAAAAVEFGDLPEAIIHVIQSFLTSKQAARTTLVSKSWRTAWLTRPNLDFDEADFSRNQYGYKFDLIFFEFVEKTLERYENQNLNIESFRLSMKLLNFLGSATATYLVHRALKLGPTRLTFKTKTCYFDIPDEVFGYENLVSLTAIHCRIRLNRDECCSRLQFLCLESVKIQSRHTLFHIISSCPLIEKMSFCYVDVGGRSVVWDGLQTINLHRLKSLVLKHVNFDTVFLAGLSSKFPSLKDLTLSINKGRRKKILLISSPTLERLDFNMEDYEVRRVKLDVPSICKLTFVCSTIPDELSVTSNSSGWESYVSVTHIKCLSASWFSKLSNFIKNLKFSRISLSLHVYSPTTFDYEGGDFHIRGLPAPEIENLDIYHQHFDLYHRSCNSLKESAGTSERRALLPELVSYMKQERRGSCYALFDGLFRMCHPKMITQYMSNACSYGLRETNQVPIFSANQFVHGLSDLKESRAQVFDEDYSKWRDAEPFEELSNYHKVRFQLKWKL